MNEKLEQGKSLSDAGITDPEQVIRIISERMLDTRPRHSIRLRPYMEQAIRQNSSFGPYEADFTACWPEAKAGSAAYAAARFYASREQEVILTVGGTMKLWFNNELLLSTLDGAEWKRDPNGVALDGAIMIPVRMRKGWNELLLKSVRDFARWGFHLTIGFPRYPGMWAKDYLFATRPTFPQKDLQGEEGFAYIGPFEPEKGDDSKEFLLHGLAFPYFPETDGLRIDVPEGALSWQPVVSARNAAGFVDLNELYGGEAACAYGLTYYDTARTGLADLVLRIHHTSAVIVWIEGKEVYRSMSSGSQEIPFPSGGTRGQVLVKSVRSEVKWGFEAAIIDFSTDQRADELPDLDTWRGDEARWLYIGPFGLSNSDPRDLLDHAFDVEREVRFDRPYPTGEPGKFTYWRLSSPSTFVRPYMDGFFFGQWFYAIQVGLYGLLKAGETIGEAVLIQYVTDSMSVMAQYHDYALWDAQQFGVPSLIPRARQLEELDPCGAAGVMLLESYERTKEAAMLPVIQRLAEAVMNGVPRMEGGTFYRKETMWADDLFMSCPFLVRMGRSTGDARYYDEVIQQAAGFHRRLWMQDKRLYAHIYFPHEGINSRVPWGRGNGWVLLALTEILLHLPDEHPEREHVLVKFKELAEGIATYQADSGLWHQVLDECESYEETSCTAMFIVSIVRGIRHGWLDSGFLACVRRGWNGLLESCIDREGNVYGVCLGSGCSMDASYYYDIPTYINDDHGTGIVLLAASEMCELAKWQLHALT